MGRTGLAAAVLVLGSGCKGEVPREAPESGWSLVEELRIGALDSGGPDQFGYVADVWVDPADRVWIVDGPSQSIRVFDADGRWVRTVGRPGAGPGEFGTAGELEHGPEGRVWVADGRNGRWSVLDTAGVFLESHTYAPGMYRFGDRWGPDGFLYTWVASGRWPDPTFHIVRRRLAEGDLVPADTLPVPPVSPGVTTTVGFVRDGRRMTAMVPIPFQPLRKRVLVPGVGWWISHPGPRYRLARLSLSGDTVKVVDRPYPEIPVTEADWTAAAARIARGGEIDPSDAPSVHPPVEELSVLPDGHLLAQRQGPEGPVFDVFTAAGEFAATLTIPGRGAFELRHATDRALYGVLRGPLDVPYVVRLGLRRPHVP